MKAYKFLIIIFLLLIYAAGQTQSKGDPAPDFTLQSLDHGQITLSNYSGKVVYLYFIGYS